MKRKTGVFIITFLTLFLSCFNDNENSENTNEQINDPVTMNRIIPDTDTMQIDFSPILNMNKAGSKCEQPESNLSDGEIECIWDALTLVSWSYAICVTPLTIPVAVYNALKDQTPATATTTHVEWEYSFTFSGKEYHVSVSADKIRTEYDWDWSVIINDFEWITGSSMEDKTAGEWQYHDPTLPADANNSILLEWTRGEDFDGTAKFTNNSDNPVFAEMKGDYILYVREGNEFEVNFYDINYAFDGSNDILSIKVYCDKSNMTGGIIQNTDNEVTYGECQWNPNE
ncbi:MAG: hypothetical protein JW864_11380 [Spirochaetes bacterium]|nr:hypothetical protein [Spirochaetota bacterium]